MAQRPVFEAYERSPYVRRVAVSFQYNSGFSIVQKQKNITAIHNAYQKAFPGRRIMEISSKSMQDGGTLLSAFHLKMYVPSLCCSVPVECVFQGSKVFVCGGPYTDLYTASSRDAKRDERLRNSGRVTAFRFEGKDYPIIPRTAFYDWLYITALKENPDISDLLLEYDAFTDIEFNPEKSINCQANAAAIFVSLTRNGLLNSAIDFERFLALVGK